MHGVGFGSEIVRPPQVRTFETQGRLLHQQFKLPQITEGELLLMNEWGKFSLWTVLCANQAHCPEILFVLPVYLWLISYLERLGVFKGMSEVDEILRKCLVQSSCSASQEHEVECWIGCLPPCSCVSRWGISTGSPSTCLWGYTEFLRIPIAK